LFFSYIVLVSFADLPLSCSVQALTGLLALKLSGDMKQCHINI